MILRSIGRSRYSAFGTAPLENPWQDGGSEGALATPGVEMVPLPAGLLEPEPEPEEQEETGLEMELSQQFGFDFNSIIDDES